MPYSHANIVDDAEDLTTSQVMLLSILSCSPTKITRIQKLGIFIERILQINSDLSHGSYYYGGFSDDLGEAVSSMGGDGAIKNGEEGYKLTQYGADLLTQAGTNPDNKELVEGILSIVSFFQSLTDFQLKKLSYILYPETTDMSLIKNQMDLDRDSFRLGDLKVTKGLTREQLIDKLMLKVTDLDPIIDLLEEGRSVVASPDGRSCVLLTLQEGKYITTEKIGGRI